MSLDIPAILTEIKNGAIDAAKQTVLNTLTSEAVQDAEVFVASSVDKIERYIRLLLSSQITPEEFKSLLMGLKDLAEMNGLTVAGLAAIEVEKTRNAVLNAVTSIAMGAIKTI